MTVAEIRKAIDGLPDSANVLLFSWISDDSEGSAMVELKSIEADDGSLAINLEVVCFGEEFDIDEDEEDDL